MTRGARLAIQRRNSGRSRGWPKAPRVPTWEELNGPLPEGDPEEVAKGIANARLREAQNQPCPSFGSHRQKTVRYG